MQALSVCHSLPLSLVLVSLSLLLLPLGPFCLPPPDSLSLLSSTLSLSLSLLCVCHSHARVTRPAAPTASSCSRPSFKLSLPPKLSPSYPSKHPSFDLAIYINPCIQSVFGRNRESCCCRLLKALQREGRRCRLLSTHWLLEVQNTNATPTALQLFLMIYLLRGSLSAPKSRPAGRQLGN